MEEIKIDEIKPDLKITINDTNDKIHEVAPSVELVSTTLESIKETVENVVDKIEDVVENVNEKIEEVKHVTEDDKIINKIVEELFSKSTVIKVASAYDIIIMIMELVEVIKLFNTTLNKKDIVLRVLDRISKGIDGIEGTKDDVINKDTMKTIRMLIDNSLAEKFIDAIVNATKKKIKLNKPKFCFCF
jgi:hypothetical protein